MRGVPSWSRTPCVGSSSHSSRFRSRSSRWPLPPSRSVVAPRRCCTSRSRPTRARTWRSRSRSTATSPRPSTRRTASSRPPTRRRPVGSGDSPYNHPPGDARRHVVPPRSRHAPPGRPALRRSVLAFDGAVQTADRLRLGRCILHAFRSRRAHDAAAGHAHARAGRDAKNSSTRTWSSTSPPGQKVRIPSVGPGARVLRARAGVGTQDVRFQLWKDGAENWFIEAESATRARVVMELSIAARGVRRRLRQSVVGGAPAGAAAARRRAARRERGGREDRRVARGSPARRRDEARRRTSAASPSPRIRRRSRATSTSTSRSRRRACAGIAPSRSWSRRSRSASRRAWSPTRRTRGSRSHDGASGGASISAAPVARSTIRSRPTSRTSRRPIRSRGRRARRAATTSPIAREARERAGPERDAAGAAPASPAHAPAAGERRRRGRQLAAGANGGPDGAGAGRHGASGAARKVGRAAGRRSPAVDRDDVARRRRRASRRCRSRCAATSRPTASLRARRRRDRARDSRAAGRHRARQPRDRRAGQLRRRARRCPRRPARRLRAAARTLGDARCGSGVLAMSAAFVPFLYELRARKVKVGAQEAMALAQAPRDGPARQLARRLLPRGARDLRAPRERPRQVRRGVPRALPGHRRRRASSSSTSSRRGSQDPANRKELSPEELAALQSLDMEELKRLFEERMREQKERHQGGNRWIGTGGTSPFGAQGAHPSRAPRRHSRAAVAARWASPTRAATGRIARTSCSTSGRSRSRSASSARSSAKGSGRARHRRHHRRDGEERRRARDRPAAAAQVERARAPAHGRGRLDGSARARSCRASSPRRSARRTSAAQDLLLPQLRLRARVRDGALQRAGRVDDLLHELGAEWKLVIVGDAAMHPGRAPRLRRLRVLRDRATRRAADRASSGCEARRPLPARAWLNPDPPNYWRGGTAEEIGERLPDVPAHARGPRRRHPHLSKGDVRKK